MFNLKKVCTGLICTAVLGSFATLASAAGPQLFKNYHFGMSVQEVQKTDNTIQLCSVLFEDPSMDPNQYCKYPQKFLGHEWVQFFNFEEPMGLYAVSLVSTEPYTPELVNEIFASLSDFLPMSFTVNGKSEIYLGKDLEQIAMAYGQSRMATLEPETNFLMEMLSAQDFALADKEGKKHSVYMAGFVQVMLQKRILKVVHEANGPLLLQFDNDAYYSNAKRQTREEF